MRPTFKVADILTLEDRHLEQLSFTWWHYRTLVAIKKCRTQGLGGHIDQCTCCKKLHISYNSCRNRHCPTCQGHKRVQWIQARETELLNAPYFHVVFTVPHELNRFCLLYGKEIYKALFTCAWQTIKKFSNTDLEVTPGMIAVLHTWGQNLSLHPHLHCIVPNGGVTKAGYWKQGKRGKKFLFSVKAMSKMYSAKFIAQVRKEKLPIPKQTYEQLFKKNWVIYAKKPFGKPAHVVEYLGRYSHKIAISNHRILSINKQKKQVIFSAKDYRKNGAKTTITLTTKDFIKRFQLHILPKGFTRIRHYGILSSSWKKEKLPKLQAEILGQPYVPLTKKTKPQTQLNRCPRCKKGELITLQTFDCRGPPKEYLKYLKNRNEN
ncbi:MAG: IS91 family transposase [Bacteroidetes bacterium]|nr:IS91 family transposase [Bacteroidota bacterium]